MIPQEVPKKPAFSMRAAGYMMHSSTLMKPVTSERNKHLAELCMKLRKETGVGLMDAKKVLFEMNGNYDAALNYIKAGKLSRGKM